MSQSMASTSGRAPARIHLVTEAAEPSDSALVQAMRERAPRAAENIWNRHASLVRRILRRSLGPSVDVEDAVQEVFLCLFRDLESLREPAALRSFLYGITLHVATSELRRRRARRWLTLWDGPLPEREPSADDAPDGEREAIHRLYGVLDRIDAKRRMVFVLRYVEGLELTELSSVLGCSLSTTKRRVAEAAARVNVLAAKDPLLAPYLARREP
jgi:RNA polymerase sigma-70 factor (ECF subfamily)